MDFSFLANDDTLKLATSAVAQGTGVVALGTAALALWNTLVSRKPPSPPNQFVVVFGGGGGVIESPILKKT